MSRLSELIEELCPDGVEYFSIAKLIQGKSILVITPSFKLKSNEYKKEGRIPVISQELEYISGYCDIYDEKLPDGEYVCFGDHSEHIKYIDFAFVQGADGLKIMTTDKSKILVRYFYHVALNYYRRHDNYERHFKYLNDTQIPVPPLEVQREIARILDSYTEKVEQLKSELNVELDARKKQYEYYRDELLEFNEDIPLVKLGEICIITSGGDVPKERWDKNKNDIYTVPIYSNSLENDGLYGYTDIPKIEKPCVTIAGRGAGCGSAILRKQPFFPIIRLISAVPNDEVNVDYLYYCIKKVKFQIPKGGIPQLTVPMVSEYRIPLPSIEEQERIVTILDRFDKLYNDITEGLTAEIEARQKQYEYYRDKLLTFNEQK